MVCRSCAVQLGRSEAGGSDDGSDGGSRWRDDAALLSVLFPGRGSRVSPPVPVPEPVPVAGPVSSSRSTSSQSSPVQSNPIQSSRVE